MKIKLGLALPIVIVTLMPVFAFSSSNGAKFHVDSKNTTTVETLRDLSLSRSGCEEPPAEDWRCDESSDGRDNSMDIWRCRDQSEKWVCFEKMKETCTERNSGRTTTRTYKRETAACVTLSACF
jgi:hypothetical protein